MKNSKINVSKEQLNTFHSIEGLKKIISNGTLTPSEMVYYSEMTKKQKHKLVEEIYFKNKKNKDFYLCKDGRYKSYNPQLIAASKEALIDKLYDYYFGDTLETYFKKWVLRRQELKKVTNKTLEEDVGIWNRNIANTNIAKMRITDIEPRDIFTLFEKWTGNGLITYKEFGNRKRILNGIFKYCIFEGIRSTNPVTDLPCSELKYKVEPPKSKTYTVLERKKLLDYLDSLEADAYILGIQLCFYSILRIGEIKALRWNSTDLNQIYIEKQLVQERTMNEDLSFNKRYNIERSPKGNPYFSIRKESINEKGVSILLKMKEMNPNGKYLFMHDGRPLSTTTFNRRLMKYCKAIGIPYHSSHGIRFTTASICHNSGMVDTSVQKLLGHSTLRMTQHYLRSVDSIPTENQMQIFLD